VSLCGWGKSKYAAKRWLCVLGCSSFDFAEALAFCLSFFVRLLSLVSSFRVRHNGLALGEEADFEVLKCQSSTKVDTR